MHSRLKAVTLLMGMITPALADSAPQGDQVGRWLAAAEVVQRCPLSGTLRSEAAEIATRLQRWADTRPGPSNTDDARQHELRMYRLVDNGDPRINTICLTALNVLSGAREALAQRGIF